MSTLDTVRNILINEYGLANEQVRPDMRLADLGVDSLATLEFMFLLEDRFKLKFSDDSAPVETVADIAAEVDKVLAQPALSAAS